MTVKSKKSVLGDGAEFGWVGGIDEQENSHKSPKRQSNKKTNLQITKPKRQKISVYMNADTTIELKMQAVREGCSVSAIVEKLVSQYCDDKN